MFLEALILDITDNMLNLDVSKIYIVTNLISNVIKEGTIKALELPLEYRIKVAYISTVFRYMLKEEVSHEDIRKLLYEPLIYLNNINIEFRAFMLRPLTALLMIKERQRVLKLLVEEYSRVLCIPQRKLSSENLLQS